MKSTPTDIRTSAIDHEDTVFAVASSRVLDQPVNIDRMARLADGPDPDAEVWLLTAVLAEARRHLESTRG